MASVPRTCLVKEFSEDPRTVAFQLTEGHIKTVKLNACYAYGV